MTNATSTPPMTLAEASKALLEKSSEIISGLQAGIANFATTNRKSAEAFSARLLPLHNILESLQEKNPKILEEALKEARKLLPLKLTGTSEKAVAEAQHHIIEMMNSIHTEIHASGLLSALKEKVEGKAVAAQAVKTAEAATGFVGRFVGDMFHKHQSWINKQPEGGRLGFALAEFMLGGVIMDIGGKMVGRAITGVKERQANINTQGKDGKDGQEIVFVMEPMSAASRVIQGTLGGATMLGGAAAAGLGFYNVFASP